MGPDDMTTLPSSLMEGLDRVVGEWEAGVKLGRLWAGDSTLWTGAGEDRWLGWLRIVETQLAGLDRLNRVSAMELAGTFDHVVVLGMGGSSLCPEVLGQSLGPISGAPAFHVLDSTDPSQIRTLETQLALPRTLFVVSSKSGTTLETKILMEYFFDRVAAQVSTGTVGERFVAVTDPGSQLEQVAAERGFRHTFLGLPSIGGRFSALSDFGMVPASAMGVDVHTFLSRADRMRAQCGETVPVRRNPGAMLGVTLAVAAQAGRDKLTLVTSPSIQSLAIWVEQLVAESTGKAGRGLVPVVGEAVAEPDAYGDDRVFVYVRDERSAEPAVDTALSRLGEAGHPVLRLTLTDVYDLGGEFFRWEFATAVAGSILGINPFDQPDVEASKVETRTLMAAYESAGALPGEDPIAQDLEAGLAVYADAGYRGTLEEDAAPGGAVSEIIRAHCATLTRGDYLAILAYIEMNAEHAAALQKIRHVARAATGAATCVGFGPRFLHSTGQVYKGGPNTGVFIQITCDDTQDINVPGHGYSFGVVKAAQARGDLAVLATRGRRVVRVHVSGDLSKGLEHLGALVKDAMRLRPAVRE